MMAEHHVTLQQLVEQIKHAPLHLLFSLVGTGPLDPDVWRNFCWCPTHQPPDSVARYGQAPAVRLAIAAHEDPEDATAWVCTDTKCDATGTRETFARILLESPTWMNEFLWAVREAARDAS